MFAPEEGSVYQLGVIAQMGMKESSARNSSVEESRRIVTLSVQSMEVVYLLILVFVSIVHLWVFGLVKIVNIVIYYTKERNVNLIELVTDTKLVMAKESVLMEHVFATKDFLEHSVMIALKEDLDGIAL